MTVIWEWRGRKGLCEPVQPRSAKSCTPGEVDSVRVQGETKEELFAHKHRSPGKGGLLWTFGQCGSRVRADVSPCGLGREAVEERRGISWLGLEEL